MFLHFCFPFYSINVSVKNERARSKLGQYIFIFSIEIPFNVGRILTILSMVQESISNLGTLSSLLSQIITVKPNQFSPSCLSAGGCLGMCTDLYLQSYGLYGNLLIKQMNYCHRLNRAVVFRKQSKTKKIPKFTSNVQQVLFLKRLHHCFACS